MKQLKLIGARVKELREQKAFTQTQLAEKAGIRQATIADIENGKLNFRYSTIELVAKGLKCELNVLITPSAHSLTK